MLLKNRYPLSRVCFSPDEGGGGGVADDNSDPGAFIGLDDVVLDLGFDEDPEEKKKSDTVFETESDEDEDEEKKSEEDPEKKEEGEHETSTIKTLRKTIRAQEKKLKDLEKKVSGDGDADGKGKEEKEPLTDDQLKAIYEEHKDDPEVVMNIMRYMAKQGLKEEAQTAEIIRNQKELSEQADTYLGAISDYRTDDWTGKIDQYVPADKWGLKGHPNEYEIRSLMLVGGSAKSIIEAEVQRRLKGAKETGEKVEKRRVEKINQTKVPSGSPGGVDNTTKVTSRKEQIMREIGLSPSGRKIYDQFTTPKR